MKANRIGVSSECIDGQHILMMDFDIQKTNLGKLVGIMQRVIKKYHLSDHYIFKTKNGYHVYCLSKMDLIRIRNIYKEYNGLLDEKHLEFGNDVCKRYILRVGDEIKYHLFISGEPGYYELSKAHAMMLKDTYGINIRPDLNYDDSTNLTLEKYNQPKKDIAENGV